MKSSSRLKGDTEWPINRRQRYQLTAAVVANTTPWGWCVGEFLRCMFVCVAYNEAVSKYGRETNWGSEVFAREIALTVGIHEGHGVA